MDYQKEQSWSTTDDKRVGGFTITRQELNKYGPLLRKSIEEHPEEWYGTRQLNKRNIAYICERSAYKHSYINPLFDELDTVCIPYGDIVYTGTDDDSTFYTPTDYIVKNWRDETDTLHLTLYEETDEEGTDIKTIKQNIMFLIPTDNLVSQILDAENYYLSENI